MDADLPELRFVDIHNTVCHFTDPPKAYSFFKSLVVGLNNCKVTYALQTNPTIHKKLILDFWHNASLAKKSDRIKSSVLGTSVYISEKTVRKVLKFKDSPDFPIEFPAVQIRDVLERMSYEGSFPPTIKKLLHPYWRLLFHVFFSCLTGRKGGSDEIPQKGSSAVVALVMNWDYNFSKYVFEEMKSNITKPKKDKFAMFPRFLQMIFDAKFPMIIIPEPHDVYDRKVMSPNTFSLLSASRRGASLNFQGTRPLEKFGIFPEIDFVQQAPSLIDQLMNDPIPEATGSSPSQQTANEPTQESTNTEEAFDEDDIIIDIVDSDTEEANMREFVDSLFWETSEDTTPRQQSELNPPQSDSVNDQIPTSSTPTTTNVNEPIFEDQDEQNIFSDLTPMETDFFSPSNTRPSFVAACSYVLPDYPAFKGKGILSEDESSDLAHLKSRLYRLEQNNESKDFIIEGLKTQIAELERSNKDLKSNLGGLTDMVLNLKLRMDGGESASNVPFPNAQSPARRPAPRSRQPRQPAPDEFLESYLASGPQNATERLAKQKKLEAQRKLW